MVTKKNDLLEKLEQVGEVAEKISEGVKIFTGDKDNKTTKKDDDDNILEKVGDLLGGSSSKSGKKIKNAGGKKSSSLGDLSDLADKAQQIGKAKETLEKISGLFKSKK